jgi:photosystem II stability/assembly factor-like uncharacterized protein
MSKFVQIAVSSGGEDADIIYALTDDGAVYWRRAQGGEKWERIDDRGHEVEARAGLAKVT